jgi:hypothetical protein
LGVDQLEVTMPEDNVLYHHPGGEARGPEDSYVGTADAIELIRTAEGRLELWLNGCIIYDGDG